MCECECNDHQFLDGQHPSFASLGALVLQGARRPCTEHAAAPGMHSVPLHMQLEGRTPGQVKWSYLQAGPDLWRVEIGKQAAAGNKAHAAGTCCGSCGG